MQNLRVSQVWRTTVDDDIWQLMMLRIDSVTKEFMMRKFKSFNKMQLSALQTAVVAGELRLEN